jgi:hypothetical protein
VLRRQGAAKHKPARRQAAKLRYRFGPLTPSARSANLIAGDGTKNGFPAPNKESATNQKYDLTGKAPYRFESGSLQRRVRCELAPAAGVQAVIVIFGNHEFAAKSVPSAAPTAADHDIAWKAHISARHGCPCLFCRPSV